MAKKTTRIRKKQTASTPRPANTRPARRAARTATAARPRGPVRPRAAAPVPVRRAPAPPAAASVMTGDQTGKGRYVYCIVRTGRPLSFGPIGIGDVPAPVYSVRCDDLSAVVSDTPLGVLDPTRDNVLAHQRVNETVMREHTVLPMSFGTMFKTRDDVTAFLKSAYRA